MRGVTKGLEKQPPTDDPDGDAHFESRQKLFTIAAAFGIVRSSLCWAFLHHFNLGSSDFNWTHYAARALLSGQNPYANTPPAIIPSGTYIPVSVEEGQEMNNGQPCFGKGRFCLMAIAILMVFLIVPLLAFSPLVPHLVPALDS